MEFTGKEKPAAVRQFLEALETLHPEVNLVCEKGGDRKGDWWIDVGHARGYFTVHWVPESGFGLHEGSDEAAFGELPGERYADTSMLLRRVDQLLEEGRVGAAGLRELREMLNLSQTELAARLGIQQAAISKVERRQDLHIDTVAAIIAALGGTLEMKAKFPGGEVPLRVAS